MLQKNVKRCRIFLFGKFLAQKWLKLLVDFNEYIWVLRESKDVCLNDTFPKWLWPFRKDYWFNKGFTINDSSGLIFDLPGLRINCDTVEFVGLLIHQPNPTQKIPVTTTKTGVDFVKLQEHEASHIVLLLSVTCKCCLENRVLGGCIIYKFLNVLVVPAFQLFANSRWKSFANSWEGEDLESWDDLWPDFVRDWGWI